MKVVKVYSHKEYDRVLKDNPDHVYLLASPKYLDAEVEPGTAEIWSNGKLTETLTVKGESDE